MANRDTLQEAQELKEKFETMFPGREIRIVERTQFFSVLEARHCNCGAEVFTQAIGEDGLNECADCKAERAQRQTAKSQASIKSAARNVAEANWRDWFEQA